ncbi:nucleoside/nucleotide kinase family protein [Planctomonas psychrotolerans]|uniref:uridine kinase n=1 Tax=Planctomonas psychrotolerans TaxID=2528712 RepID=UPI00123AA981|nr:uridine kinase [Planctomonas psychrotolerans]
MPLYRATRDEVLAQLADEFLHNYGRGRTVLAIDGRDGAGKTIFAADLATVLRKRGRSVVTASIDAFHRPRAERYARGRTGETYYADAFDYSTFRRVLVEPFRLAGSAAFVLEAFDVRRDAPIEPRWTTAPDDAILIVDGVFLHRPELVGLWNYSIWLEVPLEVTSARMAERDGADPDPGAESNRRYVDGQDRYARAVDPRRKASVIVDNTDPSHPRRVFADSC